MTEDRLLTTREAADRLHVHIQTVRKWKRSGRFRYVLRRGGRFGHDEILIPESELAKLMKEG